MMNKTNYVLIVLIQTVLGITNTDNDKSITIRKSKNDSGIVENITDTQSFQEMKEEILLFVNLAKTDVLKEVHLIRDEIKRLPQAESLSAIESKLETLATRDYVDNLYTMISKEALTIANLANNTCTENQESIKSILSEKISTLASRDDIQEITSITKNYSNMLNYDISKLKNNVGNTSIMLNNIDYVVTTLNHSLEYAKVQLKSMKAAVDDNNGNVNDIKTNLNQTLRDLTAGVDHIGLRMENLGTQSDIKQLYIRLANLSTSEVQILRNLESDIYKYLNSTNVNKQLTDMSPKNDIAELVKVNGNQITSLYEYIKNIFATINATELYIKQIGENVESLQLISTNSLNSIHAIGDYVESTHSLLSKVELVVKDVKSDTDLVHNAVMQRLGQFSFDIKELTKETNKISVKSIVDQVKDGMNNVVANEIRPLKDIQLNMINALNSLVIKYNVSTVLDKLDDLARETKNDTTMVDLGIISLNTAFDELMFKLVSFEMTVDNVHSDIQSIKGSIGVDNSELMVTNDKFDTIESTIYSIDGTISTFLSIVQTFGTDLSSCTSNISLVKNKLDQVHIDIDLVKGGVVSVNSSIQNVNNKIMKASESISPLASKLDKVEDFVEKDNEELSNIKKTVHSINRKLDVLDNISKTDKVVHDNLQRMQTSILTIKDDTGNIKSFTSEVDDGISNIQGDINSMNYNMQNLQNIALQVNSTANLIKTYTAPCQPPFFLLDDLCITIFEIKRTWMDAKDHCAILGSQLLEINRQSISPITRFLHDRYNGNYHIWIGASDTETEGKFLWTTGNTVDLSWGWGIGQPNDWGKDEDCVELCSVHDELMNDSNCNELYHFACEKS